MNTHRSDDPGLARREGERRKQEAFSNLQAHRSRLLRRCRRVFLRLLLDGAAVATADDLRAVVDVPEGIDGRALGAVPGPLARARIIRPVGFGKSERPECHCRILTRWELADRAAAEQWLEDNPEPADSITPIGEPPPRRPDVARAGGGRRRPTIHAL